MSEPIVLICKQRIKRGQLEAYKQIVRRDAELLFKTKPGTVVYLGYVNEDGTEASTVHVFPDAESMEAHMQSVAEMAIAGYRVVENISFEIYGKPSEAILEALERVALTGMAVSIKAQTVGGYVRPGSG